MAQRDELEAALLDLIHEARCLEDVRLTDTADGAPRRIRTAKLEDAKRRIRQLFAERTGLPRSVSEALNSGDGTYRP